MHHAHPSAVTPVMNLVANSVSLTKLSNLAGNLINFRGFCCYSSSPVFVCNFVLFSDCFFACILQSNSPTVTNDQKKSNAIHFKALNKYTAAYVRFPANNCIICNQIAIFHTWRGWCLGDVCGSVELINLGGELWAINCLGVFFY